jgi:hypothetical protein
MNMQSIASIKQSLYINKDTLSAAKTRAQDTVESGSEPQTAKNHLIRTGSSQTMADAEAIFARANSYAEVSAKVQKSLQAYEAVEVSLKREAVSQLMGIDLYA